MMVNNPLLHRMHSLLGGCRCVLLLCFLQSMSTHCSLMLQQTANLGDPSSWIKPTHSRKRECAKARPMLPGGSQTRCVDAVYCCVSAEFKDCCGNSSLQRPSNSNETPAYLHKKNTIRKIGKYETLYIYKSGPCGKQKCMPVLFSGFGSDKIQPSTISSEIS